MHTWWCSLEWPGPWTGITGGQEARPVAAFSPANSSALTGLCPSGSSTEGEERAERVCGGPGPWLKIIWVPWGTTVQGTALVESLPCRVTRAIQTADSLTWFARFAKSRAQPTCWWLAQRSSGLCGRLRLCTEPGSVRLYLPAPRERSPVARRPVRKWPSALRLHSPPAACAPRRGLRPSLPRPAAGSRVLVLRTAHVQSPRAASAAGGSQAASGSRVVPAANQERGPVPGGLSVADVHPQQCLVPRLGSSGVLY